MAGVPSGPSQYSGVPKRGAKTSTKARVFAGARKATSIRVDLFHHLLCQAPVERSPRHRGASLSELPRPLASDKHVT